MSTIRNTVKGDNATGDRVYNMPMKDTMIIAVMAIVITIATSIIGCSNGKDVKDSSSIRIRVTKSEPVISVVNKIHEATISNREIDKIDIDYEEHDIRLILLHEIGTPGIFIRENGRLIDISPVHLTCIWIENGKLLFSEITNAASMQINRPDGPLSEFDDDCMRKIIANPLKKEVVLLVVPEDELFGDIASLIGRLAGSAIVSIGISNK